MKLTCLLCAIAAFAAEPFRVALDSVQAYVLPPDARTEFIASVSDASGNAYVLGWSLLVKLTSSGVGYTARLDFDARGLAVDRSGYAYIGGTGTLVKLNSSGTIEYRLSLPDSARITAVAADETGHAYVTGAVQGSPLKASPDAFQTTAPDDDRSNIFVARVNATGTAFEWLTYLAGTGWDVPTGIARTFSGSVFVAGDTTSLDFPTTPGAHERSRPTGPDTNVPFLVHLSPNGARIFYSTFVTSRSAWVTGFAADPAGNAVVACFGRQMGRSYGDSIRRACSSSRSSFHCMT